MLNFVGRLKKGNIFIEFKVFIIIKYILICDNIVNK